MCFCECKRMKNLSVAISPKSEDLFATIYEQTQQVLGPTCGFYVVTLDAERDLVRLVFDVVDGELRHERATFPVSACDVIHAGRPLINDQFVHLIDDDVVNSIA